MACDDDVVKRSIMGLVAVLWLAACTGGGDELAGLVTTSGASTPTSLSSPSSLVDRGDTSVELVDPAEPVESTESVETSDVVPVGPATAPSVVEVPATGVPGLDSGDPFCAAWSRFGGSWQVVLVGSTFLGDPGRVAGWEIASADIIEAAYADMIDSFPSELASEADIVADGYFGALWRRADVARVSLSDAGADSEAVQRLGRAWLEALAKRDPARPDLAFEIPEDLQGLVDRAADRFRSQRVEFHLDPSMAVGVETPLTDAYLETGCPDQGTLTGHEVDGS